MASTIDYVFDPVTGVDTGTITVSWAPIDVAEDQSEIDVQGYVIERSDDGVNWKVVRTTNAEATQTTFTATPVPSAFWQRVRVMAVNGQTSEPSEAEYIELVPDLDPPPVASTPTVSARLGVATVTWDGTFVGNAAKPSDFAAVQIHASTTSGFTPDATTLKDSLVEASSKAVAGLDYGTWYVRLVAVDRRGNASAPSAQASVVVEQLVLTDDMITELDGNKIITGTVGATQIADGGISTPKIATNAINADKIVSGAVTTAKLDALAVTADKIASNAITADKINVGALDGQVITGATVRSAAPGSGVSRWEADTYGIRLLDASGASTVELNATTGQAFMTGTVTTGKPGTFPRVVIDKGAYYSDPNTAWPGVIFYPSSTANPAKVSLYRGKYDDDNYDSRLVLTSADNAGQGQLSTAYANFQSAGQVYLEAKSANQGDGTWYTSQILMGAATIRIQSLKWTPQGNGTSTGGGSSISISDPHPNLPYAGTTTASDIAIESQGTASLVGKAAQSDGAQTLVTVGAVTDVGSSGLSFKRNGDISLDSPYGAWIRTYTLNKAVSLNSGLGSSGPSGTDSSRMYLRTTGVLVEANGNADIQFSKPIKEVANQGGGIPPNEVWQSASISGSGWSGTMEWYVTFDRTVYWKLTVSYSSAPSSLALNFTDPPQMPPMKTPTSGSVGAIGMMGVGTVVSAIAPAFKGATVSNLRAGGSNPNNYTYFILSGSYPTAK